MGVKWNNKNFEKMEQTNSKMRQQIEWRRSKVLELSSKEIAKERFLEF